MEQALVELVKSGVPLAKLAILLYYTSCVLTDLILGALGMAIIRVAYVLIKRWQDFEIERETRRYR